MPKTFGIDFAADVQINKYHLDDACLLQSEMYYFYSDKLANLKVTRDAFEGRLDFELADLSLKVRTTPIAYLDPTIKVTEDTIKSVVNTHKNVKMLRDELNSVNGEIYHLEAAVKALDHRKSELDNLVQLFAKNYYSLPEGRKDTDTQAERDIRKNLKKDGK